MQAYDKFVRFHTLIAYFPTPYNLLAEFFINMNRFYLNDWNRSVSFFLVINIVGSYCVHWKSFWCLSCDISSNFCLRYFFVGFRSIQEFVDRFTLFTIIWCFNTWNFPLVVSYAQVSQSFGQEHMNKMGIDPPRSMSHFSQFLPTLSRFLANLVLFKHVLLCFTKST